MVILTTREFRNRQKAAFDKVDDGVQVVIKRGDKSYLITPITETDKILSNPKTVARIKESIAQAERGEVLKINKDEISSLLEI